MSLNLKQLIWYSFITLLPFTLNSAEGPFKKLQPFLDQHCYECHDDDVSKGDLNLIDLDFNLSKPDNFAIWERVYDRIYDHEMPPKKKKQPKSELRKSFLDNLRQPLAQMDVSLKQKKGRVHMRRLTRREYEYTMHDLLGIDLPLINLLPEDRSTDGFETVAHGQQLSHFTMKHYLDVADLSLKNAFERAFKKEKPYSKIYPVDELTSKKGGGNFRGPQKIGKYSVAWPFTMQFYGRLMRTRAPESGWYEITLKDLHAINSNKGVVWGTLKSGACASNAPMLFTIGLVEATDQKRDVTYRAWIEERHAFELKPNDRTLKRGKSTGKGGNISYENTDNLKNGIPGIAISAIEVKRIYPNANAQQVRKKLIGKLTYQDFEKAKGTPEFEKLIKQSMKSFAARAFRRPVTNELLKPYYDLALSAIKEQKKELLHPLYVGYRAILCSPRFLTFIEKPGKLDPYNVANRLSYMLWNSIPDYTLTQAASKNQLNTPEQLIAQADRMLKHPKADRFIKSFTDQWLSLNDINDTSPDQKLFRTFDGIVLESMLQETRAFFKELIKQDLPIKNLITSNFNMHNERLARFYKTPTDKIQPGLGIQKVSVTDKNRSGLVTQGALLKVTADGTKTSPIVRGVWLSEKILGLHIPPPPSNIPAIEPDIRGAISIRDQIEKHRSNESCASCHAKIDGAGFAFENFDPVGLWRNKYGTKKKSPVVNPAGLTPDGKAFKNINDWKNIYASRSYLLAKNYAKQLVTYATGAVPSFSDRYPLHKIAKSSETNNYGMRSIIYATITSTLFSQK